MIVVVRLETEIEIEIDDKYREIDRHDTAHQFFSNPLCKQLDGEVWNEIKRTYPELSDHVIKEIYSGETFYSLYEDNDD